MNNNKNHDENSTNSSQKHAAADDDDDQNVTTTENDAVAANATAVDDDDVECTNNTTTTTTTTTTTSTSPENNNEKNHDDETTDEVKKQDDNVTLDNNNNNNNNNDDHDNDDNDVNQQQLNEENEQEHVEEGKALNNDENGNDDVIVEQKEEEAEKEEVTVVEATTTIEESTEQTSMNSANDEETAEKTVEKQIEEEKHEEEEVEEEEEEEVAPTCEWMQVWDDSTKLYYYYSAKAGASVWDKPPEFVEYEKRYADFAARQEIRRQEREKKAKAKKASTATAITVTNEANHTTNHEANEAKNEENTNVHSQNLTPRTEASATTTTATKANRQSARLSRKLLLSQYDEKLASVMVKRESEHHSGVLNDPDALSPTTVEKNQNMNHLILSSAVVDALTLEDKSSWRHSQRRSLVARMHVRSSSTDQLLNEFNTVPSSSSAVGGLDVSSLGQKTVDGSSSSSSSSSGGSSSGGSGSSSTGGGSNTRKSGALPSLIAPSMLHIPSFSSLHDAAHGSSSNLDGGATAISPTGDDYGPSLANGPATSRNMSSKELRNLNLQRVNNDKRRSTVLSSPIFSSNGGSSPTKLHAHSASVVNLKQPSNPSPLTSTTPTPSLQKRHSSTSALNTLIPVKCSGKHTLVTYGQSKFQQHRKGLFRTVVPTNKMLLYTKDKLKDTLHEMSRDSHKELCVLYFDMVQLYMLDRKWKDTHQNTKDHLAKTCQFTETDVGRLSNEIYDADVRLAKAILNICLNEVVIRSECMILLCKQCNGNPHPIRAVRGLQLLALFLTAFPPTLPILQEAVCHFLQVLPIDPRATEEMRVMCAVAEKRLRRSALTGPRKTLPSDTEFKNMTHREKATMEQQVFGVTIQEYVHWQHENIADQASEHNNDPVILVILSEAIEKLGGFQTEGIFRLPGHTQQVERLRDELSQLHVIDPINNRKQMVIGSWVKDPHVCASVFKLWLRELADPIVPDEYYQLAVDSANDFEACLQVAKNLPVENRTILNFVIHFLSRLSEESVIKKTKMTIENLAVVFAPNILRSKSTDPMTIMKNSSNEKQFVKTLVASNVEAAKRGELLAESYIDPDL